MTFRKDKNSKERSTPQCIIFADHSSNGWRPYRKPFQEERHALPGVDLAPNLRREYWSAFNVIEGGGLKPSIARNFRNVVILPMRGSWGDSRIVFVHCAQKTEYQCSMHTPSGEELPKQFQQKITEAQDVHTSMPCATSAMRRSRNVRSDGTSRMYGSFFIKKREGGTCEHL